MEVNYYSKYLKYKSKYLELKAQMGSGNGKCEVKDCKCTKYNGPKQTRENFTPKCTCTHHYSLHEETFFNKIQNNIKDKIKEKKVKIK